MNGAALLISILAILLLVGLFSLFLVIRIASRLKSERNRMTSGSEVGFVVDTFHELVARLKEKERELEALRKNAEERAEVSESYGEYILQSVPSGVVSVDGGLIVTRVNAAAEEILGVREKDVVGKSALEAFREPLSSILKGRISAGREEIQYTTSSGKRVHIGYTLTPLKGPRKETIGQLFLFTDLTALKALEAQAELRERLSSLGEMAAGMAHELRNPMGVIAGYTRLLSKKNDPSTTHIVDSISHEISVMDRIITDFLSFARPAEMNVTAVDLSEIIGSCTAHIAADRSDIEVRTENPGMPTMRGDEILLRQAFTNLIQNAVEAMPKGGELSLRFSSDGNSAEVSVSDTGHGIPDKVRDKIFLPFFTTKDRGTGLGLALVHKIVVLHCGSIAVESGEGGTTFRVRLPIRTR